MAEQTTSQAGIAERMARLEGVVEQISLRLGRVENELANKADKWEIRIWFLILMALMAALRLLWK